MLLRNRGMMEPLPLLQLCFRCFRGRDKVLRQRLYSHIVADIKGVNAKHKDNALNRRLQARPARVGRSRGAAHMPHGAVPPVGRTTSSP